MLKVLGIQKFAVPRFRGEFLTVKLFLRFQSVRFIAWLLN